MNKKLLYEKLHNIKTKYQKLHEEYDWRTDDYVPIDSPEVSKEDRPLYQAHWANLGDALQRHGRYVNYEVKELEDMINDGNMFIEDAVYKAFHMGTHYGLEAVQGDGYLDDIIDGLLHGSIYNDDAVYEAYRRGLRISDDARSLDAGPGPGVSVPVYEE